QRPTANGFAGNTLAQLLKRPEISIEQFVPVLRRIAREFFERPLRVHYEPEQDAPVTLYEEMISSHPERSEGSIPDPDSAGNIWISPRSAPRDVLKAEVRNELKSAETEIKYAGYLDQQRR